MLISVVFLVSTVIQENLPTVTLEECTYAVEESDTVLINVMNGGPAAVNVGTWHPGCYI